MENEVDEYEDVHEENEKQDDDPAYCVGGFYAPGGVLLGADGGVEELGSCLGGDGICFLL